MTSKSGAQTEISALNQAQLKMLTVTLAPKLALRKHSNKDTITHWMENGAMEKIAAPCIPRPQLMPTELYVHSTPISASITWSVSTTPKAKLVTYLVALLFTQKIDLLQWLCKLTRLHSQTQTAQLHITWSSWTQETTTNGEELTITKCSRASITSMLQDNTPLLGPSTRRGTSSLLDTMVASIKQRGTMK